MSLRHRFRRFLAKLIRWTADPPPDQSALIQKLNDALIATSTRDNAARDEYLAQVAELAEMRQMSGSGPWSVSAEAVERTDRLIHSAREQFGKPAQRLRESGATGDYFLAAQAAEWRAETAQGNMEFSRWGIQRIILITRLYYMINPLMRRLIDVSAAYVFARGYEVTSSKPAANDQIQQFLQDNKDVFGQNAITDLERRKDYDGNLYFVLFPDTENTGRVKARTFDAIEIEEIVCNPEDVDEPWLYKRVWSVSTFDFSSGTSATSTKTAWYPALRYDPADKPLTIGDHEVRWDSRVHHRKCGGVAKWKHGCPRMYPAVYWAKTAKKFLENCASSKAALAQFYATLTTKGGQQVLSGMKQQIGTAAGPPSNMLDQNPPAVSSLFASGPGTELKAFAARGVDADPAEVHEFKLMACMVKGVPETFLSDVSTGNLATAQSLDRPTETVFLDFQEAWREDLLTMCSFALEISERASGGMLREAYKSQKAGAVKIVECKRRRLKNGTFVYEAFGTAPDVIELRCNFPAIREGDIPALVGATVTAMTLNGGTPGSGIDEKAGNRNLYDQLGIENGDELIEEQYPEDEYEPLRVTDEPEPIAPPLPGAPPQDGAGIPQAGAAPAQAGATEPQAPAAVKETVRLRLRINSALRRVEKSLRDS